MSARRLILALVLFFAVALLLYPPAANAEVVDHGKTVLFQSVYIPPDEVIDGDLNVVFGDAQIAGTVRGDVNTVFGKCTILDGAQIDGQEHCLTGTGMYQFAPWAMWHNNTATHSFAHQNRRLFFALAGNAVVLLVFLLFPMRMRMALDSAERHPGVAAFVGTAAMIAAIPVAIVLLISIIGIPLIALEIAAILGGVWLGTGAVALLIGRRLSELVMPARTPSPLWALILGLVVISAAEAVPFIGWAVAALVWLVGLGSAILAFVYPSMWTTFGGPPSSPRPTIGGPPMASA